MNSEANYMFYLTFGEGSSSDEASLPYSFNDSRASILARNLLRHILFLRDPLLQFNESCPVNETTTSIHHLLAYTIICIINLYDA